jgi:glycosyltransferase involved in cell wall biosynthesis
MRIAIDTNPIYTSQAGIARYVRELLKALPEVDGGRHQYFECGWPVTNFGFRQPYRALRTLYRELWWAKMIAPRVLAKQGVELFHSTGSVTVDPPAGIRHVVTLNDVAVLRHPERFRPWLRRSAIRSFRKLAQVDRIICISQFTANEAMELLQLPANKLEVVYDAGRLEAEGERAPAFQLPPEFFLFVGSLEPGKNLSLLREAYLTAETRGHSLPPLLIAGARWEGVRDEGAPPTGWQYLGRIPDEQLIYLYRRALALVFPSKYEGFGLPILEAMGLGCPVICSRVASIPEVAGDGAFFADLTRESYCDALRALANDNGRRSELAVRGLEQAQKFSWTKCATETLRVYDRALRHN